MELTEELNLQSLICEYCGNHITKCRTRGFVVLYTSKEDGVLKWFYVPYVQDLVKDIYKLHQIPERQTYIKTLRITNNQLIDVKKSRIESLLRTFIQHKTLDVVRESSKLTPIGGN